MVAIIILNYLNIKNQSEATTLFSIICLLVL